MVIAADGSTPIRTFFDMIVLLLSTHGVVAGSATRLRQSDGILSMALRMARV